MSRKSIKTIEQIHTKSNIQVHDIAVITLPVLLRTCNLRNESHSQQNLSTHWVTMMTSSNGNISALMALCAGNSPVTGEFPAQRPVTRSFDVFFDLRLNIRLSKQSRGWWFKTPSRPLWRNCSDTLIYQWTAVSLVWLIIFFVFKIPLSKY